MEHSPEGITSLFIIKKLVDARVNIEAAVQLDEWIAYPDARALSSASLSLDEILDTWFSNHDNCLAWLNRIGTLPSVVYIAGREKYDKYE